MKSSSNPTDDRVYEAIALAREKHVDGMLAIGAVASLRAFFSAVLRMPLTFKGIGIAEPDIDVLVRKLHEDKGETIGGYYRLTAADTRQIYELMQADPV